jgi:hypothetical protein
MSSQPPVTVSSRIAWLTVRTKKPSTLPAWLAFHLLPPLNLASVLLNEMESAVLVAHLKKKESLEETARQLKQDADAASLDHWLTAVFEKWREAGDKSADRWILSILHLGSEACAAALGNAARQWAKDAKRARANEAILQLKRIGSVPALMEINHIALSTQRASVRLRAVDALEECATAQGLSLVELEDRIIPDCGLDAGGRCCFDFGKRSFHLTLTSALELRIADEQGTLREDLPKALKSDDALLASASIGKWKTMKKQLRGTLSVQCQRLERAMGGGRTWSTENFATLLVNHPVMQQLARRLVWAAHDSTGRIHELFRVCEDRTLANVSDRLVSVTPPHSVSIPHPLLLSADERESWSAAFRDYEILQPFEQLNRTTFRLTESERAGTHITQFAGTGADALSIGLAKHGWVSSSLHGGLVTKSWPGADVSALLLLDGPAIDFSTRTAAFQKFQSLHFFAGLKGPNDVRISMSEDDIQDQQDLGEDLAGEAERPPIPFDPFASLEREYPPLPLSNVNECVISDAIRDLRLVIDRPKQ